MSESVCKSVYFSVCPPVRSLSDENYIRLPWNWYKILKLILASMLLNIKCVSVHQFRYSTIHREKITLYFNGLYYFNHKERAIYHCLLHVSYYMLCDTLNLLFNYWIAYMILTTEENEHYMNYWNLWTIIVGSVIAMVEFF